jgi:hemerythrin-like domain-containing protein
MATKAWYGIDLDGTLAEDDNGLYDPGRIGRPIALMLHRVKQWLKEGKNVKILTARVASTNPGEAISRAAIKYWTRHFLGVELPATSEKDPDMVALYDDRAFRVLKNTGIVVGDVAVSSPTEDLMNEHGVLRRILAIYEHSLLWPSSVGILRRATEIFRDFLGAFHEKMEEAYIFPRFVGTPIASEVQTLIEQHHTGGALVTEFLEILSDDAGRREIKILQELVRMYSRHANFEDTVLFPAFKKRVSDAERKRLGDIFEQNEEKKFGKDGFQQFVEDIEKLEDELGISGLTQYTGRMP